MFNKPSIDIYSHGIKVTLANDRCRKAIHDYCRLKLALYEWNKEPPQWKPIRTMKKIFAGATKDRQTFHFHRNCLKELLQHLDGYGIGSTSIEIREHPLSDGVDAEHPMLAGFEARDYQIPIVEYLATGVQNQYDAGSIRVIDLQTGKGKTACALMVIVRIGKRTVIQMRGSYIDRWVPDIEKLFNYKKGEVLVIKGRASLLSIINQAKSGDFTAKVTFISNKTLFNFFKEYELNGKDNLYGIEPYELYELCGFGCRIVDEVHEDYHLSFRSDLYCHCPITIHLSATLRTEDSFRRQMYEIALPRDNWYHGLEYHAYVGCHALMYNTEDPSKLRLTERGRDTYSHGAYEKAIMRHKKMLHNYFEVIRAPLQRDYIEDEWKAGQKAVIYCYLVDFVMALRDYLREFYHGLEVNEFVAGTPNSILEESDILISTVKSLGTAHDVSGLRISILTHALNKLEANEQVKGRLRVMKKWPDVTPKFFYLNNTDVPQHMKYHEDKLKQFQGKVAYHRVEQLGMSI